MTKKLKLAFSGGGFRASFYALGGYKRLVECKLDQCVESISSVSGGSITAAAIMLALHKGGPFRNLNDFEKRVIIPLIKLGQIDLRTKLIINSLTKQMLPLKSIRKKCSSALPSLLDKYLCEGVRIKELNNLPITWYCNTTCLDTMRMFYFSNDHMYGTYIGQTDNIDDISVSYAVATSAAFPLLFAPISLPVADRVFSDPKNQMQGNPLLKYDTLWFSDGGVFDNIGTEPLILHDGETSSDNKHRYIPLAKHRKEPMKFIPKNTNEIYLVLDASAAEKEWKENENPTGFELEKRILDTSNNQIVSLRRKMLNNLNPNTYPGLQLILSKPIQSLLNPNNNPFYTDQISLPEYQLSSPSSDEEDMEKLLAGLRTDLDGFYDSEIQTLMCVGEIRMDIALRMLLPDYMNGLKDISIPTFPSQNIKQLLDTLRMGGKYKLTGSLFQQLHDFKNL
ncbi:patatin-like phospholipase family protein [Bacillus cereus]|uniref:patatin-like phospholipase family protein n=1 Tax=Bacillus cereus TaxID=1396 RepID=UPI002ABF7D1C|nr:patatin-like phospholipase family protein [Bacillus cereus]MDZ4411998.1 patatin-like phospholipase family protein [Bacillus cereus]MDZ4531833.1 patatin-like phospholipase family protein [Bacillus cereus]